MLPIEEWLEESLSLLPLRMEAYIRRYPDLEPWADDIISEAHHILLRSYADMRRKGELKTFWTANQSVYYALLGGKENVLYWLGGPMVIPRRATIIPEQFPLPLQRRLHDPMYALHYLEEDLGLPPVELEEELPSDFYWEKTEEEDDSEQLTQALEWLESESPLWAEMIRLKYLEGLTVAEIAARENITRQAVFLRLGRALDHLRSFFGLSQKKRIFGLSQKMRTKETKRSPQPTKKRPKKRSPQPARPKMREQVAPQVIALWQAGNHSMRAIGKEVARAIGREVAISGMTVKKILQEAGLLRRRRRKWYEAR